MGTVFFFQAEDGIRDHCVTGVQTCALPIWRDGEVHAELAARAAGAALADGRQRRGHGRSEEHTSELQSHSDLVCRLLLEKKKKSANRRDDLQCLREILDGERLCDITTLFDT